MARVRKSMGERNLRWTQVTRKSEDLVTEMPDLRQPVEELRELAQEIQKLEAKKSHHTAEARALTTRIRALAKRADHLRGRVGASLRGKHGFDSTVLIRYGFKPREWVKKDRADRELTGARDAGGGGGGGERGEVAVLCPYEDGVSVGAGSKLQEAGARSLVRSAFQRIHRSPLRAISSSAGVGSRRTPVPSL